MEIFLRGKKNISEEIAEEYEKYIRCGALREGEKLPSCRALAAQLGVNPNTVERAFSGLERRGLVRTLPKKGVFVCARGPESHAEEAAERQLRALKAAGLTREQALSVLHKVFGEDGDDRS